ncbi:MAG: hypothetical protein SGJ21_07305 [Alphaproteobacteria bacterium]|nr:hypothetical protein [Alphaproteobacteria bacterium]
MTVNSNAHPIIVHLRALGLRLAEVVGLLVIGALFIAPFITSVIINFGRPAASSVRDRPARRSRPPASARAA